MDMQNVSNLVIPEGNVRTIHDKDNKLIWGRLAYDTKYAGNTLQNGMPTPTTPINVDVATGTQTVTVTGKNLFGYTTISTLRCTYVNNNGKLTVTATGNNPTLMVTLLGQIPSGTYTCSGSLSGVTASPRDASNSSLGVNFTSVPKTITTNRPMASITFFTSYTAGTVFTVDLSDFQIEAGSVATDYESYQGLNYTISLGTIELCKIGDYQDYIYKSGDEWYVHKTINKVILNGSETWGGGNGKYSYSDPTIVAQPLGVDVPPIAFSNYLAASNYTAVVNDLADNIIAGYYNGGQFRTRVTSYATVNDWKTWLTTHNLTVYYQLATPTDTQITDTNLIAQLNAIHQFLTRYGYNSNVSGNLPIIIDKTDLS